MKIVLNISAACYDLFLFYRSYTLSGNLYKIPSNGLKFTQNQTVKNRLLLF